jgi:DtxR family Mn-dependent transcriptional regulator
MELEEKAEEILETLWIETSEKRREGVPLAELGRAKRPLEQLEKAGYVSLNDGRITLTAKGRPEARSVVRRHRLAERLLYDVLGTGDKLMHDKACKFEHLLDKGLDESVCHLLGHPKICPHGKPIPPGRCCQRGKVQMQKLVSPLSQLAQGQTGKVAYIYAPETSRLHYVFAAGQTQFAVDKDIADAIYVRLVEEETAAPEEAPPRPQRRRGQRFGFWGRRRHDG